MARRRVFVLPSKMRLAFTAFWEQHSTHQVLELDYRARFMSTIAERRLQNQALWCAELESELESELSTPQVCLDIPNKDLSLDNAGRLAELVILFHYLLRILAAF